jgi:hypothetical protein
MLLPIHLHKIIIYSLHSTILFVLALLFFVHIQMDDNESRHKIIIYSLHSTILFVLALHFFVHIQMDDNESRHI